MKGVQENCDTIINSSKPGCIGLGHFFKRCNLGGKHFTFLY